MNKKILLTWVCSLVAIAGFAQNEGTCGDDLRWNFDSSTGMLAISGTGEMTDYFFDDAPWNAFLAQITQIEIEDGVTSIGNWAFYNCSELISVTIPVSMMRIGEFAFLVCESLASVTIPNGVNSIEAYAFAVCNALVSVTVPSSVTDIGKYAFYSCSKLTSIEVEHANLSYSSENGILFNKEKTLLICYPAGKAGSYVVPDNVTAFEDWAFYNSIVTSITIPESIRNTGNYVFYACASLDSVSLPNNITIIGRYSFYNCSSLTTITIPESVMNISAAAFSGCTGLTSIISKKSFPVRIDSNVFEGVNKTDCVLEVPSASVDLYQKADVWKEFNQIVAIPTGIQEIPNPDALRIYPNPVLESFRIQGIEANTLVTIWDISGRMVLQQTFHPDEAVQVSHLLKGIYLVQVNGKTVRIIKD